MMRRYLGEGPLYEWDAEAAAWVSFSGARLVLGRVSSLEQPRNFRRLVSF
jgi:hypothetical protein